MPSEIVAAIIGIAGVFLGILINAGLRTYFDWRARPILTGGEDVPQESGKYVRHSIKITNDGRTASLNCNVLITIVNMKREDIIDDPCRRPSFNKRDNYRKTIDQSLCWSFQVLDPMAEPVNPAFLTIYPKSTRLVELCLVDKKSLEIEIPSELGWEIRRVILRGNNKKVYEVKLKIFAENVRYDPKKHMKKFKLIPNSKNTGIVVKPVNS